MKVLEVILGFSLVIIGCSGAIYYLYRELMHDFFWINPLNKEFRGR
ncbi:hypothetical protein FACS1894172_09420 [Spirochaetia bacterium]|nr:hypothetical protein FACS1894172_09420 [Spirochaetia bacterium]